MRDVRMVGDLGICLAAAALIACGAEPEPAPFRALLDGNRPVKHRVLPKLDAWLQEPRRSMFLQALELADRAWNPQASGEPQSVILDLDDGTVLHDGENPCTRYGFALWSVWGGSHVYVCSGWKNCRDPAQTKTHYGIGGCIAAALHEYGHLWGFRGHLQQLGRPRHNAGPIMAGWSSDAIDPTLRDYTQEDVSAICGDGGHGGRCP